MRHSVQDWYNIIIAEKENQTVLNTLLEPEGGDNAAILISQLNSKSKVSPWRLFAFVIAAVMYLFEGFWLLFKNEVEANLKNAEFGTSLWFVEVAKKFQDGDPLQIITAPNGIKFLGYTNELPDSDAKRVVKLASAITSAGVGYIKVATITAGVPAKLTNDQIARFKNYIDRMQPFGAAVQASSDEADKALFDFNVYFDPLLDSTIVQSNVLTAVTNYLLNIEFGGKLELIRLIDAIQQVAGVTDVFINSAQAKADGGSYTEINRVYQTEAGYIILDEDSVFNMIQNG